MDVKIIKEPQFIDVHKDDETTIFNNLCYELSRTTDDVALSMIEHAGANKTSYSIIYLNKNKIENYKNIEDLKYRVREIIKDLHKEKC